MKLAFQRRFLDDDGNPLNAGRITLYAHDSQTPLVVYYLEGDDYSPAPNPMLTTNDGRIDTVFYDGGIIDVKVEKNNGDGTFELLDTFEDGLDTGNTGTLDKRVSTIDDLRKTDPSVGTVTVTGYYAEGDSPVRTYMWDADSTDTIDGGYVIGSEVSDTGRWILIWDDEMIPCTVYGIIPGAYEENISRFLGFPVVVGTKAIATARICRFIAGDYSTTQNYYTNKTLYFDSGSRFPFGYFSCKNAIVPSNTGYVAELYFNGVQKEAHSSWFRTVKAFLLCKAQRYVIDATNYFESAELSSTVEIADSILEFHARLPVTYADDGRMVFSRCDIQGCPMFSTEDRITFRYTRINDGWWQSASKVDWVDTVLARTAALNVLELDNFASPVAYVNAIKANGNKKLDMAGRHIGTLDAKGFTEIANVDCNEFRLDGAGASYGVAVKLRNVSCDSMGMNCHTIVISDSQIRSATLSCENLVIRDSTASFASEPAFVRAEFYRSEIDGATPWTGKGQLTVEDGRFNVSLDYVTDNESTHPEVKFFGCHFGKDNTFRLKDVTMTGCTFDDNKLAIYPYKDGDDYILSVNLQGNIIRTSQPIEFTRMGEDEKVYDCILRWTITDNIFSGNAEGLRMRYWQRGVGWFHTFVKISATAHTVVYQGNTGSCPDDTGRGLSIADNKGYVKEDVTGGHTLYKYPRSVKRLMPTMLSSTWWLGGAINGSGMLVKYYREETSPYDSLSYDLFVQTAWLLYPTSHDDPNTDGDFFSRAILILGDYLRIVQRGDNDHNNYITGQVV